MRLINPRTKSFTLPTRAAVVALAACVTSSAFAGSSLDVPGPLNLTIQEAIDIADSLGASELVVAPGEYFENIDLKGKALTLRSSGGAAVTTINGGAAGQVVRCITGETSLTVIEGFTLTNGLATGPAPNDRGAGLYCNVSSPTIRECVFLLNDATVGGGMYANQGSPSVADCTFLTNTAHSGGAAYLNQTTVTFADCTFDTNDATVSEGGASRIIGGTATFERCLFTSNGAVTFGGAIANRDGSTTIDTCVFDDNFCGDGGAQGRGGAVYHGKNGNAGSPMTITNTTFLGNDVTMRGGALYAAYPMTVLQCSFHGNTAGADNGTLDAAVNGTVLRNCVAWSNGASPLGGAGTITVTYSNIEGGFTGAGNIGNLPAHDPLFVNAASSDLRLAEGSPCIDAGDATAVPADLADDFDGNVRAVNAVSPGTGVATLGVYVDMGAFEYQPEMSPGGNTCSADATGDGIVDTDDFLAVLVGWGVCPAP